MVYRVIKTFKIKDTLYPKNSLLNLPEDKVQILLNKNLIQLITYDELCQKLTKELREDNRQNNSKGLLVKLNFLDENVVFTTPEHFEELKREGYIVYLPEELVALLIAKPKPQTLKTIHEIKKSFDGKIKSAPAEDMKRKWQ